MPSHPPSRVYVQFARGKKDCQPTMRCDPGWQHLSHCIQSYLRVVLHRQNDQENTPSCSNCHACIRRRYVGNGVHILGSAWDDAGVQAAAFGRASHPDDGVRRYWRHVECYVRVSHKSYAIMQRSTYPQPYTPTVAHPHPLFARIHTETRTQREPQRHAQIVRVRVRVCEKERETHTHALSRSLALARSLSLCHTHTLSPHTHTPQCCPVILT